MKRLLFMLLITLLLISACSTPTKYETDYQFTYGNNRVAITRSYEMDGQNVVIKDWLVNGYNGMGMWISYIHKSGELVISPPYTKEYVSIDPWYWSK